MRYVLALLAVVNAWGIVPASSEECEPGLTLASLDDTYTVGSARHRTEPDRNTAVVKEGEFNLQRRLQLSREIARIESGPWSLTAKIVSAAARR